MVRTKKRISTVTDCGQGDQTPEALERLENESFHSPRTEKVKRVRRTEERNGWIKSIEVTDFMCHRHLRVNLNSAINFITGNNGSGKSALLTALSVCLGGRASTTQRASSLASLIREGSESASVKITLNNSGEFNAYRPEQYGDVIIIERRFSRNSGGQNRYITFGSNGRIVSEKKEEITQICDHFSIQVDNPLSVLSQETAKRFLANAKPKELYEFFMKATQLEQLAYDYMFTKERVNVATARIKAIKETWTAKEARIKELESLLREVSRQKEIRQSLREIKSQIGWSMVAEKEDEVDRVQAEIAKKEAKLDDLEEAKSKIMARAEKIQEEIVEKQREANSFNVELEPIQRSYDELNAQLRRTREEKNRLGADLRELNFTFKEENNALSRLKENLEEELRRNDNGNQKKLHDLVAQINGQLAELNRSYSEHKNTDAKLKERRASLNEQVKKAREIGEDAQQKYDTKRRALEQLQRAKGNKLQAYDERMPALVAEIERTAGNFHRKPVGPIGTFVELKDKKWELPIEVMIGKELSSFIVKDQHDHDLLRSLMRKHNISGSPICIIRSDDPLDFRSGEPEAKYITALRVLNISHPLVLKSLIITCGIERAVLMEDRPSAKDVLRRRVHGIDSAYTPYDRVFVNGTSHSSTTLYRSGKIALIQDGATRIKELEVAVKDAQSELAIVKRDFSALETEISGLGKEIMRNDGSINQCEREIRNLKARLQEAQIEQASIASHSFSTTEEEIRHSEEKLETIKLQFAGLHEQQAAFDARMSAIEEEMKANIAEQDIVKERAEVALEELHQATTFRRNVDKELVCLEQSKQHSQSEINLAKAKEEKLREEIKQMSTDLTSKLGPRVDIKTPRGQLEKELAHNTLLLEELVRTQPDPAQLLEEITELRDGLAKSQRLVANEDHLMMKMKSTIGRREKIWAKWLDDITKLSNMEFILMLQARGFQGKLQYDKENCALNIRVKPQAQVASDQVRKAEIETEMTPETERDIKQLSGGEKSYSTACFFFSLWTAMSSPLRALDEFDVFMDQVNRDFVIRELVKNARSSRVQFILITPNSICNSINLDQDIKIIRLDAPDRRQGVIA